MSVTEDRVFYFHADASALGGRVTHPREQVMEAHAPAHCRRPEVPRTGLPTRPATTPCSLLGARARRPQAHRGQTAAGPRW